MNARAKTSRHSWDFIKIGTKRLLLSFIATVHFGYLGDERTIFWMTEVNYYKAKFTQFIRVLGLDRDDANRPKIHLQPVLPNEEMRFMYPRNEVGKAGKVTGMYTYYSIMNRLLRKTISQGEEIQVIYPFMQITCLLD